MSTIVRPLEQRTRRSREAADQNRSVHSDEKVKAYVVDAHMGLVRSSVYSNTVALYSNDRHTFNFWKSLNTKMVGVPQPREGKEMVDPLSAVLAANREWCSRTKVTQPELFDTIDKGQSPNILWIGCSDSRVAPNVVTNLGLGDLFVHRNIGNTILPTDFNSLCVMQYAVEHLKVKHIIVCGHYKCGAVQASMGDKHLGLLDQWLAQAKNIYRDHLPVLQDMSEEAAFDKMCELNCLVNFYNVCHSTIVQQAFERGQELSIHAWCFRLSDGKLVPLAVKEFSKCA
ncbi:carbonic anhydrase [Gorgonomyces haynaldii]|nr:carbonic anhydrase [Gorgonomyces haynaldii]